MRILVLDSALPRCLAAAVEGERVLGTQSREGDRGQAARLPAIAAAVLSDAGWRPESLGLVAVTVGPGSFTGIRAALSLAHGIGLAAGVSVVGVTVGESLADSLPDLGGRRFWSVIDSRRGRVFLECAAMIAAFELDGLPWPDGPVAIAGNAAIEVAARLAAQGADVMLTDARWPSPRHVARVARLRLEGDVPPLPAQPLYVDAPEAAPSVGLRPPPESG